MEFVIRRGRVDSKNRIWKTAEKMKGRRAWESEVGGKVQEFGRRFAISIMEASGILYVLLPLDLHHHRFAHDYLSLISHLVSLCFSL